MASIETLHESLLAAATLLDTAAGEIREISTFPTNDNIYKIGKALAEIYEVLRVIYAVHPDLKPVELVERKSDAEANKRLGPVLDRAYQEVRNGNTHEAILLLQEYAENEPSQLHRDIALNEVCNINGKWGVHKWFYLHTDAIVESLQKWIHAFAGMTVVDI